MNTVLSFAILLMVWIAVVHPLACWTAGRALTWSRMRGCHRPMLHRPQPFVMGNEFPRKVS